MMVYLLKSSFCLMILFGIYKLFLEREKMPVFNRFYLLSSLLFSLLVPLIAYDIFIITPPVSQPDPVRFKSIYSGFARNFSALPVETSASITSFLPVFYSVVSAVLMGRFLRNLAVLIKRIKHSPKRPLEGAMLVSGLGPNLPYTFLHYIFVDQKAFQNLNLEPELLTHELAHVRQKHSFDLLLVELLLVFMWFNPLIIWLRKAIQLNHEFLADDAVNKHHQQVSRYQQLILSKVSGLPPALLTSSLTFQITKQRFLMMTKKTSRTKARIIQLSVLALSPILAFVFSAKTAAQVNKPKFTKPSIKAYLQPDQSKEELYKDVPVLFGWGYPKEGRKPKKYSELTQEEKKLVKIIPPDPKKSPTELQFEEWKNPNMFGIWLNGKRIKNEQLNKYSPTDIASFWGSYVHKNARRFGKHHYQFELMTNEYYAAYLKDYEKSPIMIIDRPIKN